MLGAQRLNLMELGADDSVLKNLRVTGCSPPQLFIWSRRREQCFDKRYPVAALSSESSFSFTVRLAVSTAQLTTNSVSVVPWISAALVHKALASGLTRASSLALFVAPLEADRIRTALILILRLLQRTPISRTHSRRIQKQPPSTLPKVTPTSKSFEIRRLSLPVRGRPFPPTR